MGNWDAPSATRSRPCARSLCPRLRRGVFANTICRQERSDYRYTRYDIIPRKGLQAHGRYTLVVLCETSMILYLWRKEHLDRRSDLFRLQKERELEEKGADKDSPDSGVVVRFERACMPRKRKAAICRRRQRDNLIVLSTSFRTGT